MIGFWGQQWIERRMMAMDAWIWGRCRSIRRYAIITRKALTDCDGRLSAVRARNDGSPSSPGRPACMKVGESIEKLCIGIAMDMNPSKFVKAAACTAWTRRKKSITSYLSSGKSIDLLINNAARRQRILLALLPAHAARVNSTFHITRTSFYCIRCCWETLARSRKQNVMIVQLIRKLIKAYRIRTYIISVCLLARMRW